MLFSSGLTLPADLDFTVVGVDAGWGHGQLVEHEGRVVLVTGHSFSIRTGTSTQREVQGSLDGEQVALRGDTWIGGGQRGLLLSELSVGSDELTPEYVEVRAVYEHGAASTAYRFEDGAARSPDDPIQLPAVEQARAMELRFPSAGAAAVLRSAAPAALTEYDAHLAAFQDLLTIIEDQPIGRLSLAAIDAAGRTVRVHGHDRFAPFNRRSREPYDLTFRLSGTYSAAAIDRWWRARVDLRPVTQVLAGTLYQPGYVESSIIALSAIAQRTARELLRVPYSDSFRSGMQALIDDLGPALMSATKVDASEWLDHLVWVRNDIAHEGAPNNTRGTRYVDEAESRAVRDATRMLVTLVIVKSLGVPAAVLARAADRFGVRYGPRHWRTTIFTM
ncbi:MAG: hypothetical protein KF727_02005 [Microbacteriaceae bacterium]|nr:hypothetical protein [Microbacteriaceae bacterium]